MTIYLTTVILCVVILVSVVPQVEQNLTLYGAVYAYGTALATSTVLIIVFFTKVRTVYKCLLSTVEEQPHTWCNMYCDITGLKSHKIGKPL